MIIGTRQRLRFGSLMAVGLLAMGCQITLPTGLLSLPDGTAATATPCGKLSPCPKSPSPTPGDSVSARPTPVLTSEPTPAAPAQSPSPVPSVWPTPHSSPIVGVKSCPEFGQMDLNQNGQIELNEYLEIQVAIQQLAGDGRTNTQLKSQFTLRDTDGNGFLTEVESCAATPRPSSPRPTPTTSPPDPTVSRSITGTWTKIGVANRGPVYITTCYPTYVVLTFTQTGADVVGELHQVYGGGAAPQSTPYETLKGTQIGAKVVLDGEAGDRSFFGGNTVGAPVPVHYELTYDPSSKGFVGTANGVATNLATLYVNKPANCGPPPP